MEKLLDGIEVEWKALGDIVNTITAPAKVKKETYRLTGKVPIIDQGLEYIAGYTDENIPALKRDQYVVFGDLHITVGSKILFGLVYCGLFWVL